MKIALVHDYLIDYGGAERVLEVLHQMYPKAPIYTILVDRKGMGKFWERFEDAKIYTSWFGYLPFASKLISPFRFLIPLIWGSFDFGKYDLVITSASWAVTKGLSKNEVCYLHTPPRYLYGYDTSRNWSKLWFGKLVDLYGLVVNHFMRQYDFLQAQKVKYFIANCANVAKRIEKFYRRTDYKIIYPPVEVEQIINSKLEPIAGDYYLTGGRMTAAKNFDLIIHACRKEKKALKIYGTGIEENNLRRLSGAGIEFLGRVDDETLIALYKGAKAYILAQKDEDFGMTSVEAQAAGCPVIAFRGGGYTETVIDGKTGIFFDDLSVEGIIGAMRRLEKAKIKKEDCIDNSRKFSKERFVRQIREVVNNA